MQLALSSPVRFGTGGGFAACNTLTTLERLGPLGRDRLNVWVRIFSKNLGIRIEPSTSLRGAAHATLAIALSTGLNPDNAVHVLVVDISGCGLAEAGLDVAPVTPVVAGTTNSDTALINDEVGGKTLSLEGWGKVGDEVALVVGLAAISDVFRGSGVESVVVGDVGGKPADPAVGSPADNIGELGGG